MDPADKATKLISDLIDVFITRYPTRTAIGALLGIVFIIINHAVSNLIGDITNNPLYDLDEWYFVFAGIFILHIPTLFQLIKNRPEFDEDIEKAFKAIEKAKINGMPQHQVNQAYKELCELVLKKSDPDSGSYEQDEQNE
jgi:hypothetical protein